ncbi:MAG: hypothetical protein ACKO7D_11570 [Bacteroidota bacterium]
MSEKEITQIENSILQARKEGLLKAGDTTMQSHGKLWGMDVFSWINPKPAVLAATMDSFPFPIFWISSSSERTEILEVNVDLNVKIQFSVVLDSENLPLVSNTVVSVSNLNEAFDQINKLKTKPSILLFTYSKSDWEYQKNRFNDYLSMAQVK